MNITKEKIEQFLRGETSKEETAEILLHIAVNPELEEQIVTRRRQEYISNQMDEYGCFIPIKSMAADDGKNLCDFQCESYILKKKGKETKENMLSERARQNYWLRGEGTPLYNIGKLMESEGLLVNRCPGATMTQLMEALKDHAVIAVVNGDMLSDKPIDIFDEDFSMENDPNHAVVVLKIDKDKDKIALYNPAVGDELQEYSLNDFENAWTESNNYMVMVREKRFPQEYNPQPIDISNVQLDDDLLDLTETIAQDVHDIWAVRRFAEGYSYGPERDDSKMQHPDLVPYADLPESEKDYDREMSIHAIKLVKRLGYRILNINSMYRCPDCGEVLEMSNNFCPNCGRVLGWEDFR